MKKTTLITSLAFLITFLGALNLSFGQSIFDNPITGANPSLDNPYTTGQNVNDPNITVSGIGRSVSLNITATATQDRYNARSWPSAFDSSYYFEFTITPSAGYEIDFASFEYNAQRSGTGPPNLEIRTSLDGYTTNVGTQTITTAVTATPNTIDLSAYTYQNIVSSITFRVFAWGSTNGSGTLSINDFIFNGVVRAYNSCASTVTWDGASWSPSAPNSTTKAIVDGNYDTLADGNFTACSLVVNSGNSLNVADNTYIVIENDVDINGTITVQTEGAFVQNDTNGAFSVNSGGLGRVNKQTATKAAWFYYTYWSSPVVGETIGSVFPDVDGDRRFWFNAANFVDNIGFDDIDDNGDDWQPAYAADTMTPGVGYAVTEARLFFPGASGTASFDGEFNTGDIDANITYNVTNTGIKWNFIGNPYPSAIDFDAFHAANSSVISGVAYFWSQASPPDTANPGNQNLNFSINDYATYTVGVGPAAGASGIPPTRYVASAQGFFIPALTTGTATFTNAMRMADGTSNTQFFRESGSKKKSNSLAENRLWVNLTSDNGVFNQILVGYVNGATNGNDGLSYDAPRLIMPDAHTVLYSTMVENNKKYVIQGKDINSINEDEVIKLGFSTTIDVATLYKLSLAQLEGDFLSSNNIYLKDNLLNTVHNLSVSDYTFTSEVGEFNNRFEIVFKQEALSTDVDLANANSLKIVALADHEVQFTASNNLKIKAVNIYDLFGRQLYQLKGQNTSETYKLPNLKSAVYIAKVELSNGALVTKKAIKK